MAATGRLRRSDPNGPGIRRRRRGRGFSYTDAGGGTVGQADLERIRALAIPPAWLDVWICSDPMGHLQAVGTDSAGRRQYLYHDRWRQRRDASKFDRMIDFASALPRLRRTVAADLTAPAGSSAELLSRTRVLAACVRLLDLGTFRIGNAEYADEHETFGLTTLLRRHVQVTRGEARFTYVGKYSADLVEVVHDSDVYEVLLALRRRRAPVDELFFGWKDGREWCALRSEQVNEYLQEFGRADITAKDFRTWHATVLAAVALCGDPAQADTKTARKRALKQVYGLVSDALGNTAAVVKSAYVDPRLIDRYENGVTLSDYCKVPSAEKIMAGSTAIRRLERGVMALLQDR